MNNIQVPRSYRHLMTTERQTTDEYKPQIRQYIEARSGEVLTNADFQGLLGTTSAMAHVKKLMRQGHITRHQLHKGRGKHFSYKWHDTPLPYETAARKNGDIIVKNLNLPQFELTIDNLPVLVHEFARDHPDHTVGAH